MEALLYTHVLYSRNHYTKLAVRVHALPFSPVQVKSYLQACQGFQKLIFAVYMTKLNLLHKFPFLIKMLAFCVQFLMCQISQNLNSGIFRKMTGDALINSIIIFRQTVGNFASFFKATSIFRLSKTHDVKAEKFMCNSGLSHLLRTRWIPN